MISLENLCMIIRQKTISTFQGKAKLDHREKNVTSVVEDIKAFTSQNIAEEFARAIIQFQKMNIIPLKIKYEQKKIGLALFFQQYFNFLTRFYSKMV